MFIGEPRVQELCNRNGEYHDYLFLWREVWSEHSEEPLFVREMSFLDVGARQWYSIPTAAPPGFETRCMYMNDGLVANLVSKSGVNNTSAAAFLMTPMSSRLTSVIPIPPEYFRPRQPRPMIFPMDQENPTGSRKTFVITNLHDDHTQQLPQKLFLHDSQTDEWRGILQKNQPYVVKSAATLGGTLYITSDHVAQRRHKRLQQCVKVSSYDHEEDNWKQRVLMKFGNRTPVNSQLVVAGKRLFVVVQLGGLPSHNHVDLELPRDKPASSFVIGRPNYPGSLHEMYEIQYDWTSSTPRVVQFDCCQIRDMFGEEIDEPEIFPCVESEDKYSRVQSCLLVSRNSGQIRKCTFATGSVDVLPQHPLLPGSERPGLLGGRDGRVTIFHGANNMKLRFIRNVEPESAVCASSRMNPPISPSGASSSGK